ncbi:MAG: TonB-dependent receptor plug domain-containing protein, partial [Terriglobales bacterium]
AVSGPDGRFTLTAEADALRVTAPGYAPVQVKLTAEAARAGVLVVLYPAPLEEAVTVTATARNQATAAVPLETAVMGRARLQSAAPANADSILREFSDLGTFRVNSSLTANPTTQGVALLGTGSSGASRALVLLDGLPLDDFYGGWVDWLRVPDEDLSDISVVSGGASPLYGNDALSGVIGLETRAPGETHLDLRVGGGGLDTALADGAGVVATSALALTVRGRGVHVGGYVPAAQPGLVDDRAGVTAQDWAPELRWLRSPTQEFSLASEYFAEDRRNGTQLQVNGTRLRQLAAQGTVEAAGVWEGSVFYQSEDFHANFSALAPDRNSERLTLEQQVPSQAAGAGLDWTLATARWSLMLGGDATHIEAVDNETAPPNLTQPAREENGRQRLAGVFVEATWSPRPGWSWIGTLRQDHWSNFDAFQFTPTGLTPYPNRTDSAVSPSLGTVWAARPWLSLRLSGYESFRAPTLNELYRPFRAGNVETLANPLLEAERYRGAQAGAELAPFSALRLRATYFDGYVTNLVTSVTLSTTPGLITRQRQNLGRVRPRGETVGGEWRLRPDLTLWADYTHLSSTVLSAPTAQLVGLKVAHVPDNDFSARALLDRRGWTFSAVERFGGANFDDDQNLLPLPAFWTTDLYLSRAVGRVAPYVAVENLWNRRYAIELTPEADRNSPRALTAGVRVQWGGAR